MLWQHTSQGQALYNGVGGLVALTDSVRYVRGNVENTGEFDLTTAAGSLPNRLFIDEGNLLNTATGKWVASKSTVVLMGMNSHVISMNGATLCNLRLDNPAGTTLGSDATIAAGLRLATGNLTTTAAFGWRLAQACWAPARRVPKTTTTACRAAWCSSEPCAAPKPSTLATWASY